MRKIKILIIDDDLEFGDEMAEMLETKGYAADTVYEVPAARDLIAKDRHDVFLLDFKINPPRSI